MASKSLYKRALKGSAKDPFVAMSKMSPDWEPLDEYEIREKNPGEFVCNCPAHITNCRHIKMLPMFERAEKGEDPLYNQAAEDADGHKYTVFLEFNGKMAKWVRGPEKLEM